MNNKTNNEIRLNNAKKNVIYIIKRLDLENLNYVSLLNNLGIIEKEKIILLKTNYGNKTMLVNVSGINFALDKKLCEGIIIE